MKYLFAFILCITQMFANGQSLTVKDVLRFAEKNISFADNFLTNKGFKNNSSRTINGQTLYNYGTLKEAIYFGTALRKTDQTDHCTVTYMTSDITYVLDLIKQIANEDVTLNKKYSDGKSTTYDYQNSNYIFNLSIADDPKDFSSLMIVNLKNAY